MKLLVKKVYCQSCQKLVSGVEKAANGETHIYCFKCQTSLWLWNGIDWKHGKS